MSGFTSAPRRRWLYGAAVGYVGFIFMTWWVAALDGPAGIDLWMLETVVGWRSAPLTAVVIGITNLGSTIGVIVVTTVAAVTLLWSTRRLLLPLTLAITVAGTATIVFVTKIVIGRDRPPLETLIGSPATDASFPSGHTADGSTAFLLSALYLSTLLIRHWSRTLLVAAGILIAIAIGFSRIYLGYHWTTDVLGGWLLAVATCGTATYVVCRLSTTVSLQQHLTLSTDVASPRGAPAESDG